MIIDAELKKRYAIQRKTPENDGFPICFGISCVLKKFKIRKLQLTHIDLA